MESPNYEEPKVQACPQLSAFNRHKLGITPHTPPTALSVAVTMAQLITCHRKPFKPQQPGLKHPTQRAIMLENKRSFSIA